MELDIEGTKVLVQAAVSENLPVSVLLGTDVPELGEMLRVNPSLVQTEGMETVLVMNVLR